VAEIGLIIHEGQLTFQNEKLVLCEDLGVWWGKQNDGLPLPLGGNVINKKFDLATRKKISDTLTASIQFSLDHRPEAVQHALQIRPRHGARLADKFVGMYVNHWTLDYGEKGRESIRRFLGQAFERGLIPHRRNWNSWCEPFALRKCLRAGVVCLGGNGGGGELVCLLWHLHERVEPGHLRCAAGRGHGKAFHAGTRGGNAQPVFPGRLTEREISLCANSIPSFAGEKGGAVSAFAIDRASGKLNLLNQTASGGTGPCHVSVDATGKFCWLPTTAAAA